jgi:beta-lactam-binding protein with PASTA domain
MSKALELKHAPPESFPPPPSLYAAPVMVVNRGGVLSRDDGDCPNAYQLEFFGGQGPPSVATCKANEVEIPDVVGQQLAVARARLEDQPLTPSVVFKPAKTGDRVGYVVGQFPRKGTASAHAKITLISAKSRHGVIPRVVGLELGRAQERLARLHLDVRVEGGTSGKVVEQSLPAETAAAPGVTLTLTVGRPKR